jgi:hypothetical protein
MDILAFKELLKNAKINKKELAELLEVDYNTVNAWGTNGRGYPYWVKSWLENYIKAKDLDNIVDTVKPYINIKAS